MTQKQMLEMLKDHLRIWGENGVRLNQLGGWDEYTKISLEWVDHKGENPTLIDQILIPKVGI